MLGQLMALTEVHGAVSMFQVLRLFLAIQGPLHMGCMVSPLMLTPCSLAASWPSLLLLPGDF